MHHDTTLIALVAMGFVLACAFGYLATRVRLPPIVGYLVAGIAVGPFTPGFVGDAGIAGQLAEIGVILLMFGVGLHFSLDTLLAVRGIAVPGAVAQIAVATLKGSGLAEAVTAALNHTFEDGTYQQVLERWGLQAEAIEKSETNPPGLPKTS